MWAFNRFSSNPQINENFTMQAARINTLFTSPREVAIFNAAGGAQRATAAGYYPTEMPILAKAFVLYQTATGCSNDEALEAALDPLSDARRLLSYGGRFTENAENYREGLRLMPLFRNWYRDTVNAVNGGDRNPQSPTKLNLKTQYTLDATAPAMEKFVFEEIAYNPLARLDSENSEELFGMGSNKAMRFIARGYAEAIVNTLENIPPDKRGLLYDVFDVFDPLPKDQNELEARTDIYHKTLLALRVLQHYDEMEALRLVGNLDRAHLIQILYSDFDIQPTATNAEISDIISERLERDPNLQGPLSQLLDDTGAPLNECLDSINNGAPRPPLPQWASVSNCDLRQLDGSASGGRDSLFDDLYRPVSPIRISDESELVEEPNVKFVFNFPNNEQLFSKTSLPKDDPEVVAASNAIADKIKSLCGNVHQKQLSSVYFALSQGGLISNCRQGFRNYDISSDEHMPVTFTLSKDNDTGAVTITYTQPTGFPLNFHWTTTVALDGSTTSTQIVIENPPNAVQQQG